MTYRLQKLAAGSYDVILNDMIIASLVRESVNTLNGRYRWTAELLFDAAVPERPPPFTEVEHVFWSLRMPAHGAGST